MNSLKELLDLARAKPGALFYSAGAPVFQVATELLKKQTGVDMVFVPFKGTGPALNAAIAGETPVATLPQASALAQLRAGKLRARAITSLKRSALLPDVPTIIGPDEAAQGEATVRDLRSGQQQVVGRDQLVESVHRLLK